MLFLNIFHLYDIIILKFFSHLYRCFTYVILFHAGDDLYPNEPDILGLKDPLRSDLPLNELEVSCVHQNRFIFHSVTKALVNVKNISTQSNHHIIPISSTEFVKKFAKVC